MADIVQNDACPKMCGWSSSWHECLHIALTFITEDFPRTKEIINYLWTSDLQTLSDNWTWRRTTGCLYIIELIHHPPIHIRQWNVRSRLARSLITPAAALLSGPCKKYSTRYSFNEPPREQVLGSEGLGEIHCFLLDLNLLTRSWHSEAPSWIFIQLVLSD